MTYYILHKDGLLVGVHPNSDVHQVGIPSVSIDEHQGDVPNLNRVAWDSETLSLIENSTKLSRVDFINRFTASEFALIESSTDANVRKAYILTQAAEYIDVNDQLTMMFVGYLAMLGIIANERVAEILN